MGSCFSKYSSKSVFYIFKTEKYNLVLKSVNDSKIKVHHSYIAGPTDQELTKCVKK